MEAQRLRGVQKKERNKAPEKVESRRKVLQPSSGNQIVGYLII